MPVGGIEEQKGVLHFRFDCGFMGRNEGVHSDFRLIMQLYLLGPSGHDLSKFFNEVLSSRLLIMHT